MIGAAIKGIGSIFGGITASKAMKKVEDNMEEQKKRNLEWYERRYNEDFSQRADAQRLLTQLNQSIRDRNRQASGTNAVVGGTEASVAAAKAANNVSIADTMSRLGAAADARKDSIEQTYQTREATLNDNLNNLQARKAQNIATATQGVMDMAGSIASPLNDAVDSWLTNLFTKTR